MLRACSHYTKTFNRSKQKRATTITLKLENLINDIFVLLGLFSVGDIFSVQVSVYRT